MQDAALVMNEPSSHRRRFTAAISQALPREEATAGLDADAVQAMDDIDERHAPGKVAAPLPTAQGRASGVRCLFCSTPLRLSRFRTRDLSKLLLFLLPLRCPKCGQRQYANALMAALAGRSKSVKRSGLRPHHTWKDWTEAEQKSPTLARPMTTAAGPKAQRLEKRSELTSRNAKVDDSIW